LTDASSISLFVRVTNFPSVIEPEALWQEDGNLTFPTGSFVSSTQGTGAIPSGGAAVQVSALPEPGVAALLPLGVLLLAGGRRRSLKRIG
jgi:MYXO-CTERM domain-containing protein